MWIVNRKYYPILILILLIWLVLSEPSQRYVHGQDDRRPESIVIGYPELVEGTRSQTLNLYFNIVNRQRQPLDVIVEDIESALITINGRQYPTEIIAPETPLYIVVVLDVSGSMIGALENMKRAAIQAIAELPDRARITVLTFNTRNNIRRITGSDGFVEKNLAINAIAEVQIRDRLGTCLYDATYTAVELLRAEGLRPDDGRAVVLFTDGRDELTSGRGDRCSQRNPEDILELARDPAYPVPLHTIGLRGVDPNADVNVEELRDFAIRTGGFTAVGGEAQLSDLFSRITQGLTSQRIARALTCEQQGDVRALLELRLLSGRVLSETVDLTVGVSCIPPTATPTAEPLAIGFDSIIFNPDEEILTIRLQRDSGIEVDRFRVRISSRESGTLISGGFGDFLVPGSQDEFSIRTNAISSTETLVISVIAQDAGGADLGLPGIREVRLTRPTPTPSPTERPSATPETITFPDSSAQFILERDVLVLNIRHIGSIDVLTYRVRVISRTSGLLIDEFDVDAGLERVEIPTSNIPSGERLSFTVTPLDINGTAMVQRPISLEGLEVLIIRPTPSPTATDLPTATPTPTSTTVITNTAVPIRIEPIALDYNEQTDELSIQITRTGEGDVASYRVQLFYRDGIRAREYILLADQVEFTLSTEGLRGNVPMRGLVAALNQNGNVISENFEFNLEEGLRRTPPTPTATPSHTPTDTPTATPTPSPTPIVVSVTVTSLSLTEDGNGLILQIRVTPNDVDVVNGYQVRLNKQPDNLEVRSWQYNGSPPEQLTIPLDGRLDAGEYELALSLNVRGQAIAPTASQVFRYSPPAPPAPTFADWLRQNTGLLIGVVIVLMLIVVALLIVFRNRDTQPAFTPISRPPILDDYGNPTIVPDDADIPVRARLIVKEAPDGEVGREIPINATPFRLGRDGGRPGHKTNADFKDVQVSRAHAAILYEDNSFIVQDAGSQSGTFVNGTRISEPYRIQPGETVTIGLGKRTKLAFVFDEIPGNTSSYDPNATQVDVLPSRGGVISPSRQEIERTEIELRILPKNELRLIRANGTDMAQPQQTWQIMDTPFTLGKAAGNSVQIDSKSVSRTHAIITYEQDTFHIEDANSTNGTFLNDEKLVTKRPLKALQTYRISLGRDVVLEFRYEPFRPDDVTQPDDTGV